MNLLLAVQKNVKEEINWLMGKIANGISHEMYNYQNKIVNEVEMKIRLLGLYCNEMSDGIKSLMETGFKRLYKSFK